MYSTPRPISRQLPVPTSVGSTAPTSTTTTTTTTGTGTSGISANRKIPTTIATTTSTATTTTATTTTTAAGASTPASNSTLKSVSPSSVEHSSTTITSISRPVSPGTSNGLAVPSSPSIAATATASTANTSSSTAASGSKTENVTVTVRIRPFSNSELKVAGGLADVWDVLDDEHSKIGYADDYAVSARRAPVEYIYDHALTGSNNEEIYNSSVRDLVQSAMEGYNGTVFAYGQTSSGKTYSGNETQPGITPRAVEDIFKYIRENPDREFLLRVSYLEIYNESIRDLLSPEAIDLRIHEDRRAASNEERRKEGAFINKSLLTLGTVISKLTEEKGAHIPYRDSKLTRILQSSLNGSARVSVICTISPSVVNVEESHNTLKFAARVKKVVTKAQTNQVMDDKALLEKYRREISELKAQLTVTATSEGATGTSSGRVGGGAGVDGKQQAELSNLLEKERMRHEEQMVEMNMVRNALKKRIDHLTKLILTSQSVGTVASAPEMPAARYTVETSADGTVREFPKEIESRLAMKDAVAKEMQQELESQQEKVNLMKQTLERIASGQTVDINKTLSRVKQHDPSREKLRNEKRATVMNTHETKPMNGVNGADVAALKARPQGNGGVGDRQSTLVKSSSLSSIQGAGDDDDLMDTPWNREELQNLRKAKFELEIIVREKDKKLEDMVAFEDSDELRSMIIEMEEQREKIVTMDEEREVFKRTIRELELKHQSSSFADSSSSLAAAAARIRELEATVQKEQQLRMKEQRLRLEEHNRNMGRIASLEAELNHMRSELYVHNLAAFS
ncbi:hypothetical protein BGZ65_002574 [Modicella reniformis]|uniref:Kinesin motor domain-containing protein n=1 Tax=Modicella reniformis TaxID=1440133 RepID=A0A9P6INL2_9FUNG|nr:hypothetical protein BGZ65_002574 [Modicella reniformis]